MRVRFCIRNILLIFAFSLAAFLQVPVPRIVSPESAVLLDRDGRLLGATIAADQQWRFPPLERVPERYAVAVRRYEDQRFLVHPGVDGLAIARAVRQNLRAGHVVSGASTLTMQVVRIARGNRPRTFGEKVVEAALAVRLELAASKDEILAAYASSAPFGGNTVGLEAAAWRYFGRRPEELSWGEAAALAVLPNSPSLVHPGRNRDQLRAKRDRLLDALVAAGELSADDATLARAEPLPEEPVPVPQLAPHLLAKVDGRVVSTLDGALQQRATEVLVRHHERLAANGVHNAAAVIVDVETGAVLAWVGNVPPAVDDQHQNHVDVVTAPRSTGSLLKPFLYLAMVEDGSLLPNELVPDLPMRLGGFAPENFDHRYDGAVPAAQALARSRNVPAVWMLREYGVDRFYGLLTRLGMRTLHRPAEDYGLSLVLGGAEGTLLELTGMYRQLAWTLDPSSGGLQPVHWRGSPEAVEPAVRLDPGASWLTVEALLEVNRPVEQGAWRTFSSSRRVAWKTGTSFGFRDGWAIGVDPRVAVGVWVGNADGEGRPELTGYTAAAPLLFELLDRVPGHGWFSPPDPALVDVEVCAHSGMLAGPDCAETHVERVPRSATRGRACGYCEPVACDAGCAHRVNASCAEVDAAHTEPWFVLPPAIEQYYVLRNPHHRSLPPFAPGCEDPGASAATMSLVTPREGGEVYVPIELDGSRGRVVFDAAHREAGEPIYWHLDHTFVAETRGVHQLAVAPEPGEHRLVLVDRAGSRIERRFTVLEK